MIQINGERESESNEIYKRETLMHFRETVTTKTRVFVEFDQGLLFMISHYLN